MHAPLVNEQTSLAQNSCRWEGQRDLGWRAVDRTSGRERSKHGSRGRRSKSGARVQSSRRRSLSSSKSVAMATSISTIHAHDQRPARCSSGKHARVETDRRQARTCEGWCRPASLPRPTVSSHVLDLHAPNSHGHPMFWGPGVKTLDEGSVNRRPDPRCHCPLEPGGGVSQ